MKVNQKTPVFLGKLIEVFIREIPQNLRERGTTSHPYYSHNPLKAYGNGDPARRGSLRCQSSIPATQVMSWCHWCVCFNQHRIMASSNTHSRLCQATSKEPSRRSRTQAPLRQLFSAYVRQSKNHQPNKKCKDSEKYHHMCPRSLEVKKSLAFRKRNTSL